MMKAVAYDINDDGDSVPVCTITFDGKNVTFEGKESVVSMLKHVDYGPKDLTPADGKPYMDALGKAFKGSRFFVNLEAGSEPEKSV